MHLIFEDRQDAGTRLANRLAGYQGTDAIVLGIPRGGVPVAASAARMLHLDWNVVVVRKLSTPWKPETAFGAVAADGTLALNDALVRGMQMHRAQIDEIANEVKAQAERQTQDYAQGRPFPEIKDRCVIVIDDGLASGHTMLAAIKSLRVKSASKIVAASPIASRSAAAMIEEAADECQFEIVSPSVPFAIADFYVSLHNLTDDDVMGILSARP